MGKAIAIKPLYVNKAQTFTGTSFGVPWPRKSVEIGTEFRITSHGRELPFQNRPLAYWPDGSVKWTGFTVDPIAAGSDCLEMEILDQPDRNTAPSGGNNPSTGNLETVWGEFSVTIRNSSLECEIPLEGNLLIKRLAVKGRETVENGRLVCSVQNNPSLEDADKLQVIHYESEVSRVVLENEGSVGCTVKITGVHRNDDGEELLPFVVRLYFYSSSRTVRIIHSFIYNADEQTQFIQSLGIRFDVPLDDQLHDRHVRFSGENGGLWGECVRHLSGLRRFAGKEVMDSQFSGDACPELNTFPDTVGKRMDLIPAYNDYSMLQTNANSFMIRKRTGRGCCWLDAGQGKRSPGFGYIGGPSGGAGFGIRNFWQSYPAGIDIRNAAGDTGEVTLWLWAPGGPVMDMRFYHDGMGQDTSERQLEGLEITYEDYEPGYADPKGIARTSELFLFGCEHTPGRETLNEMAGAVVRPPRFLCSPEYYNSVPVFGDIWDLPDRSNPHRKRIEDHLDWLISYYLNQQQQHYWYGFWNYGDVMHTYDHFRHTWRYDVGGFAWDNSELSTDLWLWYSFLRTGREDIFTMAEAMTRHTGEVDVYHEGPMQGLGSRHNVLHWGCSAKQVRISSSVFRRFYYYLTADERTGDLLEEVKDADRKLLDIVPLRKYPQLVNHDVFKDGKTIVSLGTDWCTFAMNWLTQWERTGDITYRDKIIKGMKAVAASPHGWFTSCNCIYDPETSELTPMHPETIRISHLNAVFGAPELHAELLDLFPELSGYRDAWLEYCEMYSSDPGEFEKEYGVPPKGVSLITGCSRMTAYAAFHRGDERLKRRAWTEFIAGERNPAWKIPFADETETEFSGSDTLNPVIENLYISTNHAALWGLAGIQNLALIGDAVISEEEACREEQQLD